MGPTKRLATLAAMSYQSLAMLNYTEYGHRYQTPPRLIGMPFGLVANWG